MRIEVAGAEHVATARLDIGSSDVKIRFRVLLLRFLSERTECDQGTSNGQSCRSAERPKLIHRHLLETFETGPTGGFETDVTPTRRNRQDRIAETKSAAAAHTRILLLQLFQIELLAGH